MNFDIRMHAIVLALCGMCLFAESPATMSLSEVQPGMKGQGRTVFLGGTIDKFDFKVLGVQRSAGPGRSIIWVKVSGGPLADTGIMHGMSGSPCYINGKLIGAIALGPEWSKEAIGGITPIGEMLDQLKEIPDLPVSRTPLILPKLEPPKVLKSAMRGEMIPLSQFLGGATAESERPDAHEIPMLGLELCQEARSLWQGLPMKFVGSMAKSSASGEGEASPVEPGGMVVVKLLDGDMEMGAAGTIATVSGKKVMLFGHPLFNLGPIDLPLYSATVVSSLPSYQSSSKMAFAVAPIGAARLDRSTGVVGLLGAEAKMVPLRVGLNLGGKRNLNFKFELMDHPFITPILAATVVSQTLSTHLRGAGLQSLSLQGNIKLAGHSAIQIENMVADLNSNRMAQYVGAVLQSVTMNPFEKPVFEGISINIKAEERLDLTAIAGARILKARVKRGEVLPVLVTLQNIQGVRETATLNVNVPSSARPGKATLMVGDGISLVSADPDERAIDITSLSDIVRLLNGGMHNNHAYALLVQAQPGAGLRGSRIEGIPPTVFSLLGSDGDGADNRLQRRIIGRALLPLEREVRGLVNLDVEIE